MRQVLGQKHHCSNCGRCVFDLRALKYHNVVQPLHFLSLISCHNTESLCVEIPLRPYRVNFTLADLQFSSLPLVKPRHMISYVL